MGSEKVESDTLHFTFLYMLYGSPIEINEELYACFIDWQKAFDHVNWTKLMQILKRTGIDWCERRLISKLYMDQRVKV